jgi:RHH-type transcriptional regulator, proline utilization regulon repressor / proline dehydrogenase / delta 1-pyrroline-5-carboxylate dehydrogenase
MSFDHLDDLKFVDESAVLQAALAAPPLSPDARGRVRHEAEALVWAARRIRRRGAIDSFLQEFSLSTPEGLALMCIAEALLRTPDEQTRGRLIAAKLASADWASHVGRSDSLLVNASTWSLMLTGKLVALDEDAIGNLPVFIHRLAARLSEPVIRAAVGAAVRIMGEQFVLGATIGSALKRARRDGFVCSFDMLGEAARTEDDAERYQGAYAAAIAAVGAAAGAAGPENGHGVSVKLSALSPRYEARQAERVWRELYPRLKTLAMAAAKTSINLTIDAEEADRLTLSLAILDRLARESELAGWKGLGLAVQAYQKRAPQVIEAVADIARASNRQLMVRLVKGAYWDTEIKRAQIAGLPDYTTYTTKAATDVSYLVCARALIAAHPALFGQFATHNAYTLAAVRELARERAIVPEFQRLHGMGEALYAGAFERYGTFSLRVYAPVGSHEDLLPYLVRRLLENGANTSFVNALLNEHTSVADVVPDPLAVMEAMGGGRNPRIPRPFDLYGSARRNSAGVDLSIASARNELVNAVAALDKEDLQAGPIVKGRLGTSGQVEPRSSPADLSHSVGHAWSTGADDIDAAFAAAKSAQPAWNARGGVGRGAALRDMGDALETNRDRFVALLAREAGRTVSDGIAEVREAIDFCRYYASLAELQFVDTELRGPVGETNHLQLHGRGIFVCISPWNFPLSIFTGQVAAALAAGNAVLAKPAEQTPLIAAQAVRLFHGAGLAPDLLHLLPGAGETIGATLVTHAFCDGVAFTGGTETAWAINRALAARRGPIIPFIAETGGLNAMFVDTTALREQFIDDVLVSAFGSAGQRCSSLRLLFLPHETADTLVKGLAGAMRTLVLGDPADPRTDVGPIIDAQARAALETYAARLYREAKVLQKLKAPEGGTYFGPLLAEIPSAAFLQTEVFGPILHVVRYNPDEVETAAAPLRATGYGLTLGIHSRIETFADHVQRVVPAGNVYVNRAMTGAVVGVQPFGGLGLSGTGPKAGGPHSLLRYATERAVSINTAAQGGDPALLNLS